MKVPLIFDEEIFAWLCDTEVYAGQAYLDQGGHWAYGFGHSRLRPPYPKEGDFIAYDAAVTLLRDDLSWIWARIAPSIVPELSPVQQMICCSLAYNTGPTGFKNSSVLAMINNVEKKYHMLYASIEILGYCVSAEDRYTKIRREFAGLKGRRIDESYYLKREVKRK